MGLYIACLCLVNAVNMKGSKSYMTRICKNKTIFNGFLFVLLSFKLFVSGVQRWTQMTQKQEYVFDMAFESGFADSNIFCSNGQRGACVREREREREREKRGGKTALVEVEKRDGKENDKEEWGILRGWLCFMAYQPFLVI